MRETFRLHSIRMIAGSILLLVSILFSCDSCEKNPANNEPDSVTDIDGNEYQIVKIGNQWWMAENLKVMHYRNGDAIPNVTDNTEWSNLTTGARCAYDNDENQVAVYGLLYNWYSVTDSRNIAPEGWHVPTDAEWQTLIDCLGGESVAGGKLKEAGTAHWESPNLGATNESGFTALPGGYRGSSSTFYYLGKYAGFWSATEYDIYDAWYRDIYSLHAGIYRSFRTKQYGFSVRCVRN